MTKVQLIWFELRIIRYEEIFSIITIWSTAF